MSTQESTIDSILSKYDNAGRAALIPLLQEVQEALGHLSKESIIQIGEKLDVPSAKIFGVATFYNQFRFQAPGDYHIQVCRGTACHVKDSSTILESLKRELSVSAGETTRDGMFSLEVVACIGACGLAPVIAVNGEFHAKVKPNDVKKIVKGYKKEAKAKAKAEGEAK